MITPELLAALAVFAAVSSVTPGPNNLMLMASGINFGFRRTLPHMLGVGLGFTLMIILIGLGVMQFIEAIPASGLAIAILSAVYMLYMAWKIATTNTAPQIADGQVSGSKPFTFLQAALFQWVNPKAWTMALTAISIYTPKSQGWLAIFIVAGIFGIINLPCTSLWAAMGAKMSVLLSDPIRRRVFNIIAALLLVASLYPTVAGLIMA
jgi:threonine/homoserine/homoserine lactone efflux protein